MNNHKMFSYGTDINECENANGGCEHDCINTIGNSTCNCYVGHLLDQNGLNCSGEQNYGSPNFCKNYMCGGTRGGGGFYSPTLVTL